MSKPEFGTLPEIANPIDANEITDAYSVVRSGLADITDENIDPGSVFNRHIVRGETPEPLVATPFKEIISAPMGVNLQVITTAFQIEILGDPLSPTPALATFPKIDCRDVFKVIVFATIPCRVLDVTAGTPAGTVSVEAIVCADVGVAGARLGITGAQAVTGSEPDGGGVVEDEIFNLQMVGSFNPILDEHQVSLWLVANTTANLELNKAPATTYTPSMIAWTLRT